MKDSSIKRATSPVVAEATLRQRIASDPTISSWVGASAGSGKTKVLTDRMLRLLLPREDGRPGTAPEKILALTFTKAAANEMALRLSKRLSVWAVIDEDALRADMEENLFGRAPTREEIQAARKLFSRVVDTPGGLKIMTIHSFCQSVLGRFPIEAGLPPQFKPLEEEQARELIDQARRAVLLTAHVSPGSPLSESVGRVSKSMNEEQFSSILDAMIRERHQISNILERTFGIEGLYTNLCVLLDVPAGLNEDKALSDFCRSETYNESGLREVCRILAGSKSKTDQSKADIIQNFLDADVLDKSALYESYKSVFLTDKNEPRKNPITKPVLTASPDIFDIFMEETARVVTFENLKKGLLCALLTRDLFRIGEQVLNQYQNLKDRRGVLDFDDLIIRTLSLLKGDRFLIDHKDVTPWIMYKLDEGLDHVLIDEAQDTNPEQWDIIRLLSGDFFNGLGAKDNPRSIFVVGDDKQSIFSFQRAAPEKFGEMFEWFKEKIRHSGERFIPVDINTSFRSVQILLDAVDTVFENGQKASGLSRDYQGHMAKREGQSGLVELWPLFKTTGIDDGDESEDKSNPEEDSAIPSTTGWFLPDRLVESQSGSLQMAAKIGDTIHFWLKNGERLESYQRAIQAGDILILVRARNAFVGQLVRALKSRGIPVSGVDRMILGEQLVVQDLCVAARFALLPDDDLSLATLLKSPFIGYSEDRLYDLSYGRSASLWNRLRESGDTVTIEWLENLITRAGIDHPYEFLSRIVQEPCPADQASGHRAIRTRLGDDSIDPLDEFLNLALNYESSHTAGLQGFIAWHEHGQSEIKRQLDEGGGAVRIMTVHGSKGLQAPIVFLPDTVRTASSIKADKIFWPEKTGLGVPLYVPTKDSAPPIALSALQDIERKMDEEYRRLLYVAMTRAEERLYIGGYVGKRGPAQDSKTVYWYDDIRTAFATHKDIEQIPSGIQDKNGVDEPILRLSSKRTSDPDKEAIVRSNETVIVETLPDWAKRTAPEEPVPPRPLTPSRPSGPEPAAASPRSTTDEYRFKRGNATHKLMQILPDLPPDRRMAAAEQFVARVGLGLPPDVQKDIVREVLGILNHETFRDLFGPGSLAEVPVTGLLDGHVLISGQIDRLLVREKDILIVDFKTNRPPPKEIKDIPALYVRQMTSYADTLRKIYPGKTVSCALLWTDGPDLMVVDV